MHKARLFSVASVLVVLNGVGIKYSMHVNSSRQQLYEKTMFNPNSVYSSAASQKMTGPITATTSTVFQVGSVDDQLMDNLRDGDVLLFRRKWFYEHIPAAALLLLYRYFLDSDYDHCGVIVCDKFGKPHLLELTPLGGYKIRPYDRRLIMSQAENIMILSLAREKPTRGLQSLMEYARNLASSSSDNKNDFASSEDFRFSAAGVVQTAGGLLSIGWNSIIVGLSRTGLIERNTTEQWMRYQCPSVHMLILCLPFLGLSVSSESKQSPKAMSCASLLRGDLIVEESNGATRRYRYGQSGCTLEVRSRTGGSYV